MDNLPQPTHECKKMHLKIVGTAMCDARRNPKPFQEPHEECRGCAGATPLKPGPVTTDPASSVVVITGQEAPEVLKKTFEPQSATIRTCSYRGCDVNQQALFILHHHLKGYFVGPAHSEADTIISLPQTKREK